MSQSLGQVRPYQHNLPGSVMSDLTRLPWTPAAGRNLIKSACTCNHEYCKTLCFGSVVQRNDLYWLLFPTFGDSQLGRRGSLLGSLFWDVAAILFLIFHRKQLNHSEYFSYIILQLKFNVSFCYEDFIDFGCFSLARLFCFLLSGQWFFLENI